VAKLPFWLEGDDRFTVDSDSDRSRPLSLGKRTSTLMR
jgi:hypothetical protein